MDKNVHGYKWGNEYYFNGQIIKSAYAIQNGFVDYATLSSCFDSVLNNYIMNATADVGYWEQLSGFDPLDDYGDSYTYEVYQWYIVDERGAVLLQECDEIVFYNEELDMYLWGVTHYGTSWSYVLTSIPIEKE